MTREEPKLEEQVVSKAVELALSTQLDAAEKIDVDVQTDLPEIIQGQAERVAVSGQGLVMQQDIRIHEMEFYTNGIDINPLSALFGQVELEKPVDANGRIVLIEPDINQALNSNYVLSKAQNFPLNVDGKTVTLSMQQMDLRLPKDDKMIFVGKTLIRETDNNRQLGFTATFRPRSQNHLVLLESFVCHDGASVSLEFAVALLEKIKELIQSPYFEIGQMKIRIQEMAVQTGKMTLQIQAHVKQLAS